MSSEILALKYRPRALIDLIGQEGIQQTLGNAIIDGKIYNGYLFVGPYGCGKTSAARVFAASLNCLNGPTIHPCGTCKNCTEIFEGKNLDVKEIDAASNGKIDSIREIKEDANFRAMGSKYKIYIIDEAHSLTKDAVEAFLKLLEEAPEGVKFIFCTTDYHKIKLTIRTRCQTHHFRLIPPSDIVEHLRNISKKEGIKIDEDAMKVVAKMSKGHMRDALKYLDSLVQYTGGKLITKDVTVDALHAVDDNKIFDLLDAMAAKDMAKGYLIIQSMLTSGQDVDQVLNALLNHVRTLLIIRTCSDTAGLLWLTEEEKKRYSHQSQLIPLATIADMFDYIGNVHEKIGINMSPQYCLELFLMRSTQNFFQRKAEAAKKS